MNKANKKPYIIVVDSGALSPHVGMAELLLERETKDELLHLYVDVRPGADYQHKLQPEMHTIKAMAREGRLPSKIVGCPFVTNALIHELEAEGIPVPPVYVVPTLHPDEYRQVNYLRPLMDKAAEECHVIDPSISPRSPGSLAHQLVDMLHEQEAQCAPSTPHSRSIAPKANSRPDASEIRQNGPGQRESKGSAERG